MNDIFIKKILSFSIFFYLKKSIVRIRDYFNHFNQISIYFFSNGFSLAKQNEEEMLC